MKDINQDLKRATEEINSQNRQPMQQGSKMQQNDQTCSSHEGKSVHQTTSEMELERERNMHKSNASFQSSNKYSQQENEE